MLNEMQLFRKLQDAVSSLNVIAVALYAGEKDAATANAEAKPIVDDLKIALDEVV